MNMVISLLFTLDHSSVKDFIINEIDDSKSKPNTIMELMKQEQEQRENDYHIII